MNRRSKALLVAVVVLALGVGVGSRAAWNWYTAKQAVEQAGLVPPGAYDIGGDFTLIGHDGNPFRFADLRGDVVLMFFGYTHCPDVCPATLAQMKQVKAALGADAERFTGLFVSVDPRRDSPERLRQYVTFFDPGFVGVTGTPEQLEAVAKQFGAYFSVPDEPADATYYVDHATFGYLIDPEGNIRALYQPTDPWERIAVGVRALL